MSFYYKDKTGDDEWHTCPDEMEKIIEIADKQDFEDEFERIKRSGRSLEVSMIKAYADVSSLTNLTLWEQPFALALAYYFVKLAPTHEIPRRLLHLAIYHHSPRVRKKNKNRIRKIWKRQFGGVKHK